MKFLLSFFLLILVLHLSGQNIQWASEVHEHSSQYMSTKYSAEQVLGPANVYPEGGDNKLAWSPKVTDGKIEFIKVGFATPMQISQIVIYETHKPGAVSAVYTYDAGGKERLIQSYKPKSTMRKNRKLEIVFPLTEYEVVAVKVEMIPKKVEGYNQIDAIAISNSSEKVEVVIDLADDIIFEGDPERLGDGINTSYADQSPKISPDGRSMFFVRKNHPSNAGGVDDKDDIWVSKLDENEHWGVAYNIGHPLNRKDNNFVCSVPPDGNSLLVANIYNSDGTMGSGVSISYRTRDGWGYPAAQDVKGFYNYSKYVAYALSNSGKVLLIGCEMKDSKGDMDLYVSFNTGGTSWSEPLNLGSVINTAGGEFAPFLASDEKTLYFASDGHAGYGSADIFVTKRLDDSWTNWSKPKNLGDKINSEKWDAGYALTAKADYAYFNSMKEGSTDIYRIKLPQALAPEPVVLISGKVIDAKTNEPLEATVFYEYLTDGKEAGIARSNPGTGEYKIILPYGHTYGFRAFVEDYISINQHLDLSEVSEYQEIERNLGLVRIAVGVVVRLNNIFFEFGKSTLKEESFPELNRVVDLMEDNPGMELEMSGHTDNVGDDGANLSLSESRALAVRQYLEENGVSGSHLTSRGYGEKMPVATNDTDEGRQLNRRVEFKILKVN